MKKVIGLVLISLTFLSFVFAETIKLKSGEIIDAKIIERTENYIRINFQGIPFTCYFDEIECIGNEKISLPVEKNSYSREPLAISSPEKYYGQLVNIAEFALYNERGVSLQKSGKPKEALKEFQGALGIARKEAGMARYGIGSCYMTLKEYDKALVEFNKAIIHNPMLYDAYQNKAVTYRLMGRFQDSIDACKITISLFPDFARAYCSMGWAYEYLGNYKEAIDAHLEAIRLAPEWQFPRLRIDYILSKIGGDQYRSEIYQEIKRITNGKEQQN